MPSSPRPNRRQTLAVLLLAGSLGVFGATALLIQRVHSHQPSALADRIVSGSGTVGPASATASSTSTAAARGGAITPADLQQIAQIDAATATTLKTASHQLLVVGASYTQGLGASTPQHGYAYLLANKLGWTDTVAGVAGTGFLNPGPSRQGTFGERIARLPASLKPGLVLVQCGRNDANYPAKALRLSVQTTIKLLRVRYPQAALTFLGPIPGSMPIGANVIREQQLLASITTQEKIPFIDPIAENWITTSNLRGYTGDVPGHPDNRGYNYIADRLVADLQARLGVTPHPNPVTPGAVGQTNVGQPGSAQTGTTDVGTTVSSRVAPATPQPVVSSSQESAAPPEDAGTRRP